MSDTSTPSAVGPFCRLPSGRVIGAEYVNRDPTRSTPHRHGCECYRCKHGKPVDIDAIVSLVDQFGDAARLANEELLALGVGSSGSPALRALWAAIAKAEGRS